MDRHYSDDDVSLKGVRIVAELGLFLTHIAVLTEATVKCQ
jgi:hypothetical protein